MCFLGEKCAGWGEMSHFIGAFHVFPDEREALAFIRFFLVINDADLIPLLDAMLNAFNTLEKVFRLDHFPIDWFSFFVSDLAGEEAKVVEKG